MAFDQRFGILREGVERMRRLLTALVLVVLLSVSAQVDTFAQSDELNGSVSRVEEWVYETEEHFGKTEEVWASHSVRVYNVDRNLVEEISYSATGSIIERVVNTYDSNQQNTESIEYTSSGTIEKRIVRTFDGTGREVQIDVYDKLGDLLYRTLVEYEGNVKKSRGYNADGTLSLALDEETDDLGNVVRYVAYDEETGDVESVLEFTHTSDGKPLSTLMYDDEGKLSGELEYSYAYDIDGMDEVCTTTLSASGIVFGTTIEGTVIEIDSVGNWTEKRSYKQEERFGKLEWVLEGIHRRSIDYY